MTAAVANATSGTRPARDPFFARTALVMLAMVLLSFPLTYFWPVATHSKSFRLITHIHALAFFGWIGLYIWQTQLAVRGRTARHRELGLAGIALSAVMIPLGITAAIMAARARVAAGSSTPYVFTLYNAVDLITFGGLMIASIASVTRHLDWHRRFIFGAALCLVGPAISRWFAHLPVLSPFTDFGPNVLADLFLIALAMHDRRALGRIHPATIWVAVILVPVHLISPWVSTSAWWTAAAPAIYQLAP
jgi:hypothetical protein